MRLLGMASTSAFYRCETAVACADGNVPLNFSMLEEGTDLSSGDLRQGQACDRPLLAFRGETKK
jgi:hypothetical protein